MSATVLSNIATINVEDEMTWQQLLSKMADLAISKGWAKEGFKTAILTRESKYATGLHAAMDIAIPHADAEWTLQPAMITAFLGKPVKFQPMGGQGDEVNARFVFMLVIPDADAHIDFLQAIAGFIENEDCLKHLDRTNDISELVSYLKKNMGA